jgi:hypothetical protein
MLLKITPHAQSRLLERGFSIDQLKKAVSDSDKKENVNEGAIKAYKKLADGRTIVAIYKKDSFKDRKNCYIIITAYFLK